MFHYGYASIFNEISELDTQYTRYSSLSIAKVNQELIETVDLFPWVIRLNRVYGSNIRSARFVCTAQPPPGSPMENREVVEPCTRIERYEYLSRTHDLGGSPKEISRLSQLALD